MTATETVRSFGTFRARLGALPFQSLLLYGTAGLAIGQVSENLTLTSGSTVARTSGGYGYSCTAGNACFAGSASQTRVGWAAGAGAELALTTNLTLKGEALYVHLESAERDCDSIQRGRNEAIVFHGKLFGRVLHRRTRRLELSILIGDVEKRTE
jgi:opacity protein-like surface antigen